MGNWHSTCIDCNKVDGLNAQQGDNTGSITQDSNQSAMNETMIIEGNTFKDSIVNITQQSSSTQQVGVPPQLFRFPELSNNIVGRETDVELLLDLIKDHHQVLITGIGGLGKTTLASLCATTWVSNKEFKYAAFINVETDDSAKTGFKALAKKIFHNTDTTITEIFEHYNELPGKTLFVLDNIEEKCNIHQYLPAKKLTNVFVLGTSQFTELIQVFELYKLRTLSISSSVDVIRKVLLNNQIKISTHNIEKTNKLMTDVTEKLDCHPLALEHAAAYIADCILYNEMSVLTSVKHYIKTFNKRLEEEPPIGHSTTYRTPVHTALKMNIAKATSKNVDACKLLFCLSYLDPTRIDIEMFYEHPDFNSERIKAPIRELKKYSIISLDGHYISLHRLIQIVYRDLIKTGNTENKYFLVILNLLFYYEDAATLGKRHHFSYLIKNLNINKATMSTLYIEAFRNNHKIIDHLTARLSLINCNMDDIKDWSAIHYSVFAGHESFFEYFVISECGSRNDRLERFASDTWTVFHAQIIRNSYLSLFFEWNLMTFFTLNENQKNKKIVKGLTTLHLCVAFNVDKDNLRELIDIGCDVNIADDSGMTPILYAARNMAYELVFILHRAGATYDQSYRNLLSAASNYDHELVLPLLRTSDIDCAASDFSKTLLFWAVNREYSNIALELIKRHTDINGTDSDGDTPLLVAAKKGLNKVALELLRRGANIQTIKNYGDTLLLAAAWEGSSGIVLELLRLGANIETANNRGDTPLLVAASGGRSERSLRRLYCNADIKDINNDLDFPLLAAAIREHSEIALELLRRGANIEAINNNGDTPLLAAAKGKHSKVALELLRRDANIEAINNDGDTPLLLAVQYGLSKVALELLHRRANIEIINNAGDTPLLVAAGWGLSEVALELLRRDANVEATNNSGDTPLLAAARRGFSEVALELLRRGANIEAINKYGDTPLLLAAGWGHSEIALELLRRGANIETTNNYGDTPLLAAAKVGHSEVALELLRRGANIETTDNHGDTPLLVAAKVGHSEVALELLRRGANIETTNNHGNTPLFVATQEGLSEVVLELLRRDINIETTNILGYTPLLAAAKVGLSEVVLELLRRGANIETTNNDGDTPLLLAVQWGHSEVALELLRHGANIDAKNKWGETALSIAKQYGRSTVVQLLKEHGAKTGDELS